MKLTSKIRRQSQKWRRPEKLRQLQKWRWPQNEDNLKNEDDLKDEDNLKNEDDFKNEEDLKNWPSPQIFFLHPPSPPLKNYLNFFLMTSRRDSHTTTDIKPKMIPGV